MITMFPLASDPYVLISQAGEALYRCHEKKKTVNPVWNDQTNLCIEDVFTPIVYEVVKHLLHVCSQCCAGIQVYDRDVVGSDDFMGRAVFDLTSLELDTSMEVSLHLDHGGDEDLIRSPISTVQHIKYLLLLI